MASSSFDVDDVITKLLEVRGSRPGKQVNLTETEIRGLCTGAREIFMSQTDTDGQPNTSLWAETC